MIQMRATVSGVPTQPVEIWRPDDAEQLADEQLQRIEARTAAGKGLDGRPLRPLDDGSRSTLHDTGRLMSSLSVKPGPSGSAQIVVTGSAARYAPHVDQQRPFFGVSGKDADELEDTVEQLVEVNLTSDTGPGQSASKVVF